MKSMSMLSPLVGAAGLVFVGHTCTLDVGVYSPPRKKLPHDFISASSPKEIIMIINIEDPSDFNNLV